MKEERNGRGLSELRKVLVKVNEETDQTIFGFGETKIIVGIEGPTSFNEESVLNINIDPFYKNIQNQNLEISFLKETFNNIHLHAYPNTAISINTKQLSADGSLLAATINGISTAIIQCGIRCSSIYCALCVCINKNNFCCLDPCQTEEETALSVHTFVFKVKETETDELVSCSSSGIFTQDQFIECYTTASQVIGSVWMKIRKAFLPLKEEKTENLLFD